MEIKSGSGSAIHPTSRNGWNYPDLVLFSRATSAMDDEDEAWLESMDNFFKQITNSPFVG
jgi:hypothetical protein